MTYSAELNQNASTEPLIMKLYNWSALVYLLYRDDNRIGVFTNPSHNAGC